MSSPADQPPRPGELPAALDPDERYRRDLGRNQTITIVVIVLTLGLVTFALSMLLFRLGINPGSEVLRRGQATVTSCQASGAGPTMSYFCQATVEWEPQAQWTSDGEPLSDASEIVVRSLTPLQGEVAVVSRRGWISDAQSKAPDGVEVVVDAEWRPAPAWLPMVGIGACLVAVIGVGLGVSWVLHSLASRRKNRAKNALPPTSGL